MSGVKTILLVEDDIDLRESVELLLKTEGYLVRSASDGLEALAVLSASKPLPSLILLDWMMPRMDGAKFLEERAKVEMYSKVPVVILTADTRVLSRGDQPGVAKKIAKPVDIEVLLAAIAEFSV